MANFLGQFEESKNNANDSKRKSQIMAAVNSHFTGSNRHFSPGKVPKIGKYCKDVAHDFTYFQF